MAEQHLDSEDQHGRSDDARDAGGAGTQLGRLKRISTNPKARSPNAIDDLPDGDRLAFGVVDD